MGVGVERERDITSLQALMLFLYFAYLTLISKRLCDLIPGQYTPLTLVHGRVSDLNLTALIKKLLDRVSSFSPFSFSLWISRWPQWIVSSISKKSTSHRQQVDQYS